MRLAGKHTVVTGGSSGIGLATAVAFAREGADVTIVGRDRDRLRAAAEDLGARWVCADLAHDAGARHLAQALGERIDVLVANAGSANAPDLFDTTEETFDATIDANLKSAFFTVLRLFDLLAEDASVILTSSVGAHRGALGDPLYTAAKAGVRALARGFAAQPAFLERRIRVNALAFGAVSTPMTGGDRPELHDALTEWARAHVPTGRWGTVTEAAEPAVFLASTASSYMTGSELAVDGGLAQI